MTGFKPLVAALLLAGAATPAAVHAVCLVTDPPFLAEGPISAVTAVPDPTDPAYLTGTVTSMGVLIDVPAEAPVSTPTAILDMVLFGDEAPFPGRFFDPPTNVEPIPGFIDATVIATGCVKVDPVDLANNVYEADNVSSDVNENVLLGVVTELPAVNLDTQEVTLGVMGTPVALLQDARMPADPLLNPFGLEVIPESVPLGAAASVEGYYGQDGILHAFRVEVGAGELLDAINPQISILRFRCTGDLQLQGGLYLGEDVLDGQGNPICNFTTPPWSLRLINVEANQEIPFAPGDLDILQAPAPDSAFCTYDLRFAPATCPANVRIELLENGQVEAFATTTPNAAPPNEVPVALDDGYSTAIDTILVISAPGVLGNDTDADGDALTAVLVTDAANGDLVFGAEGDGVLPDGSFAYTPDLGFNGIDTFTYQAIDSKGAVSNTATVTIVVGPLAPVAQDANVTTPEDVPVGITLVATDANNDPLTYEVLGGPANGTLTGVAPNLIYTPSPNYFGPDSFTFRANDGQTDSNTATVSITVSSVNDLPVAAADAFSTPEDTALILTDAQLLANDTDVEDGTPIGITLFNILGLGQNATFARNAAAGTVTITPRANFSGVVTFRYRVQDSAGAGSLFGTVTITVTPVNDAPVAVNDAFTTPAGTAITIPDGGILANDTDVEDGTPSAIGLFNTALLGTDTTFERIGNSITVTPSPTFVGNLRIRYRAQDSQGLQSAQVGVIVIQVTPINLTIQRLFASNQISVRATRSIALTLDVRNRSTAAVPAPGYAATLVGVQTGGEVYRETIQVAPAPATTVRYSFPSYKPLAAGVIDWTVTVVDADNQPANDVATRSTIVNP